MDAPQFDVLTERLIVVALSAPDGLEDTRVKKHGRPAETIVEYADDHGVDLLVLGTKRRPDGYRALLGSVTDRVLRLTTRPATVVKTDVGE